MQNKHIFLVFQIPVKLRKPIIEAVLPPCQMICLYFDAFWGNCSKPRQRRRSILIYIDSKCFVTNIIQTTVYEKYEDQHGLWLHFSCSDSFASPDWDHLSVMEKTQWAAFNSIQFCSHRINFAHTESISLTQNQFRSHRTNFAHTESILLNTE